MFKNYYLYLLTLVIFPLYANAESPLHPFVVGERIGFIDSTGAVVIEPRFKVEIDRSPITVNGEKYNSIEFPEYVQFSEGLAFVREPKTKFWMFVFEYDYIAIDERGGRRFSIAEANIKGFRDGVAPFRKESEALSERLGYVPYGYLNKSGEILIEPQFKLASFFSEDRALVFKDGRLYFIDKTGEENPKLPIWDASLFSEGLAAVKLDKDKVVDTAAEPEPIYQEAVAGIPPEDEYDRESEPIDYDLWGYIDKSGEFVIKPKFDRAFKFVEGFAQVAVDGKIGFIDKSGNYLVDPKYDLAADFSEGLARVQLDGYFGFVDSEGKIAVDLKFSDCGSFVGGLAPASAGGKFGFIDISGDFAIPPEYDYARDFRGGLAKVWKDENVFYIDRTGKIVRMLAEREPGFLFWKK